MAATQPTAIGHAKPPSRSACGPDVRIAEVYAPIATKPATPTLKRPVKPHCTFNPRQDSA